MIVRACLPRGVWEVAIAATLPGCALVMNADFDGYHEGVTVDADGAATGGMGGQAGTAGKGGDADVDVPDTGPCESRLVINEVQTAGPAGVDDEFVELYNGGTCAADLTGIRLVYRSSSAEVDHSVVWSANDGVVVAPGATYVVGGASFSSIPNSEFPAGLALGASGGGLALRRDGDVVDQMGWGDATNAFVNQRAATAPATGLSVGRHPDGADHDDDFNDFTEGAPTPGASNDAR